MNKPTILISAIGGDIGSSAVRALRDKAICIVGCDMKRYPSAYNLVDSFYKAPGVNDAEKYMNFLKDTIRKENIDFFLPISEPEIALLGHRREEIETLGVKLLLNNTAILDAFLDKYNTFKYLKDLGLETPETCLLENYEGNFSFPLIVKSRTGYGSKNYWKIEDAEDLAYVRRKNNGLLIAQQYMGNDSEEYTTGVFSDGKVVSSITFRRKLGFGSLSAEAVLVDAPFMEEVAERIARKTDLVGSINIQSRRLGDVFSIFEINPRLSSTLSFRKKFGFDDVVWWFDVAQGKGYNYKKLYKSGRAVRCVSECYFDLVRIDQNETAQ
ncbi:MAG: ATP-grasp domain-containing protein [Syntrophaceae bacterium]